MPVQIGASVHNFSDPTGLLSDCHRRIESFIGSLQAVAKVIEDPTLKLTAGGVSKELKAKELPTVAGENILAQKQRRFLVAWPEGLPAGAVTADLKFTPQR